MNKVYRSAAKLVPTPVKAKVTKLLSFTGLHVEAEVFIGFFFVFSLLVGAIAGFFLGFFFERFWIFFLSSTFLMPVIGYLWLMLTVDRTAHLIEEALPDALLLMSSNLRAGMTPDKALLMSARPEFGPLKYEIDVVGREVTLGKDFGTALLEMAKRVRSIRLERAVELITSGLQSGGSLASLLEATASDLREQFLIDKKIKANVTMYVIFIFSATAVITPILFGLSAYLVEVLRVTFAQISSQAANLSSFPVKIGDITITASFLRLYVLMFMSITAMMSSSLLGIIAKGQKRAGLKYFLPMITLAYLLFLFSRTLIESVLGDLFSF